MNAVELQPCPFCRQPLWRKTRPVNPYAQCRTPDCFGAAKMSVVNLDDPQDVATWNRREGATISTKELADLRSAKAALPLEQRRHAKARQRIIAMTRAAKSDSQVLEQAPGREPPDSVIIAEAFKYLEEHNAGAETAPNGRALCFARLIASRAMRDVS